MKKNLRLSIGAALGAAAALALSSCAYDPYYTSTTVSGSYGSGYGYGHGYGGSSFSTSFFVSTGSPQWGYDPYTYCYYDYHRRAYYDPYLYGYYPVGYRPPVVYGVPHPHGWRPGRSVIAPPSRVTNVTVVNYRDRESAYRNTRYDWARQVRQAPVSSGRSQRQDYSRDYQETRGTRYDSGSQQSAPSRYQAAPSQTAPSRYDSSPSRQNVRPEARQPDVRQQRGSSRPQERPRSANRFVSAPVVEPAPVREIPREATRQQSRQAAPTMTQYESGRQAEPRISEPRISETRGQEMGRRQDWDRDSLRAEVRSEVGRGRDRR
jgi:hypothetical protein